MNLEIGKKQDRDMAGNLVNLDAHIPREDFDVVSDPVPGTPENTIGLDRLAPDGLFMRSLRKPDFQRETANWTPEKIVDLLKAFVDGDLIPAIILWRSGQFVFVIDGAHRLSAILAWMRNDYGDKAHSLNHFGGTIDPDQRKFAERTRRLVDELIRPWSEYKDALNAMFGVPEHLERRLSIIRTNSLIAQWVPAVNADAAQESFFKINQSATALDPIERRILRARKSATAIASRAINRGGTGHPYWKHFPRENRDQIEAVGRQIHDSLFLPPIGDMPIKSSDVPIAGRGYNNLPFAFDLVNLANDVRVADSTASKATDEKMEIDHDGRTTLSYLENVQKRVRRLTTNDPRSLGLHPLVYFYTRSGHFQPSAFLAASEYFEGLAQAGRLNSFTAFRSRFEDFLLQHKEVYSLVVTKLGSGNRSRPALLEFFSYVFDGMESGTSESKILEGLASHQTFYFLATGRPSKPTSPNSRGFNAGVKSEAFIKEFTSAGVRCGICGSLVHRNSLQIDHIKPRTDGGGAHAGNAQVSHPYCNSTYKQRQI